MIHLRPYQYQSIELMRDSFRKGHKRIVLTLPTGAGKSVVFSQMVSLSATMKKSCLVLTHRIELFDSTFRHLENVSIIPYRIAPKHELPPPDALVTVGMVETVMRRIGKGGLSLSPSLIIVDEAHFGNFTKLIELFPDSYIIGVTATPIGKHFHKLYTDIVANIDIPELIRDGFLMPCKPYHMVSHDLSDVAVSSTGEYDSAQLFNHFDKPSLYEGVVDGWKEIAGQGTPPRTIVFNVNVAHTEKMTTIFNEAGIPSQCVTSSTPAKMRKQILSDFSSGLFPVLNNCGILTTGYDEPSIEMVIMNRATKSLPLWLQCQGRGSRTYPNKTHFTVLDYGDNHKTHGLWCQPRVWTLDPPKKRGKEQAAPVRMCPKCNAVLFASTSVCSYCGYEFPETIQELKTGRLEKVKNLPDISDLKGRTALSLTTDELIRVMLAKRWKIGFIKRLIMKKGDDAVKEFIEKMGYKKMMAVQMKHQLGDPKNIEISEWVKV